MEKINKLVEESNKKISKMNEEILDLKMKITNLEMKLDKYKEQKNNEGVYLTSTPKYVKEYVKKKQEERKRG